MPQKRAFVETEILLFEFELFIGGLSSFDFKVSFLGKLNNFLFIGKRMYMLNI
jgi:hypothetical protein